MAVMDEFKEERESIKQKPFKDKIGYILDYYKWPIISVVAAIAIISSIIYTNVTKKEEVLSGLLLNANLYGSTSTYEDCITLSEDFLKTKDFNNKEHEVNFNTSISYYVNGDSSTQHYNAQNQMVIMTFVSAGTVDFISADADTMISFAYQDYFMDLSEILSKEDYAAYEPYFLYMDEAVLEQLNENKLNGSQSAPVEYPDCTDPNSMEKPIPVLIDMSQSEKFMKIYNHPVDDTICFGFTCNLPHEDTAVEFLKYMMP